MPVLVLLTIFLAGYSFTLPGALDGFKYLLIPDFSRFSIMGVVAAMGQMFYSMSLGMAIDHGHRLIIVKGGFVL